MRSHQDDEQEHEGGRFAVPGEESHESEETLGPDEVGEDPQQPPSEPKQPS